MRTDFENMNLRQLIASEAKVKAASTRARERDRKALEAEIKELLKGSGMTTRELFGNGRRNKAVDRRTRRV